MKQINIFDKAGSFAENKDIAKAVRIEEILPALNKQEEIILDFKNVEAATQSFIHALLSDVIRKYGGEVLDKISFRSCNDTVKKIIGIVVDYMQE
ncbi:MAG: STAS-like domain-containing protein [Candidatus Saganbacteria bacterium]|nr:STAS-like domain-containing protein [Candidatus Saganbacteria bacterium]